MVYRIDFNHSGEVRQILAENHIKAEIRTEPEGKILSIDKCYSNVYGLGERFDSVDQKGKKVRVEVEEKFCNQGKHSYCPLPFFFTDSGYGLFLQTETVTDYTFEKKITVHMIKGSDGKFPYGYLFLGNPKEIIHDYTMLTGKAVLPPKWSFGIWMSANRWNTQKEVINQICTAEKLGFPASVVVIEAWSDEATFYRFNDRGQWENPKEMIQDLKQKGYHVVLWQIPVIKGMREGTNPYLCEDWKTVVERGYCILNSDGTPYLIPEGHWFAESMLLDFSNPEARNWWFEKRRGLLEMGVDGFKTDGGEFVLTDEVKAFDGRTGRELRNGYCSEYIRSYAEFIGKERVLFSRAGYIGQQRYPIQWAGDQQSTWDEFRHVLTAGLSAGLSGIVFWSFDIGGFSGELPSEELYERATQLAVFSPIMQWHSEPPQGQFADLITPAAGINDRSPWNIANVYGNQELLERVRYLHMLRMYLLPYLYCEAGKSVEDGLPMMRHLCLEYPEDPDARRTEDEFMIGDLLVCPVLEEGAETRYIYLPEGEWYDLSAFLMQIPDGFMDKVKIYSGKQYLSYQVSRTQIPVFLRKGGGFFFDSSAAASKSGQNSDIEEVQRNVCLAGTEAKYLYWEEGHVIQIPQDMAKIRSGSEKETAEKIRMKVWQIGGE